MRPKGKYSLSQEEQDCLTWMILSGRSKMDSFTTFVRPDLRQSKGAQQWADQFFSYSEVRNYIKEYEQTLKDFFSPKKEDRGELLDPKEVTGRLSQKALRVANEATIDTVDDIVGVTDALKPFGYLKEQEQVVKGAVRVLTERCAECRYKKFIDEEVKNGNIEEIYDEV